MTQLWICLGIYIITMIIIYFLLTLLNRFSYDDETKTGIFIVSVFWPIVGAVILVYIAFSIIRKILEFILFNPLTKFAFRYGKYLDKEYQNRKDKI